ncbi:MAG: PHP domain-containing protein [Spirochaetales bacterium]|nr:PHP domain-containing protein [Spirochaetales bacterium]
MTKLFLPPQVPQDLHIHTVFSTGDSSVLPEQNLKLIADLGHARIIGIADHLNYISGNLFKSYEKQVRSFGFKAGVEVNGSEWIKAALEIRPDYYIYHCRDSEEDYEGVGQLIRTGKPLIIAHPLYLGTRLDRIPAECFVEINNRYIWRSDWKTRLERYVKKFRFIISSDAHQPHWLNQNYARFVADQLGVEETILF